MCHQLQAQHTSHVYPCWFGCITMLLYLRPATVKNASKLYIRSATDLVDWRVLQAYITGEIRTSDAGKGVLT